MRKFASLGVALIGLYVIAQSGVLLGLPISYMSMDDALGRFPTNTYVLSFLPLVVSLAVGAVLIAGRNWIAARLADDVPASAGMEASAGLRLALIVAGVVLVAQALPSIAAIAANWAVESMWREIALDGVFGSRRSLVEAVPELVVPFGKMVIGAALLMWSDPLARRLWCTRGEPHMQVESDSRCASCGAPFRESDYADMGSARCDDCDEPLRAST